MCIAHVNRVKTLYKSILRLHRGLPTEIQELGSNYVKDEFKRHKNLRIKEDQQIISGFMWEWTEYAINLAKQLGVDSIKQNEKLGKNLDVEDIDKFKEEQIVQLHELYLASKGKENEEKKN